MRVMWFVLGALLPFFAVCLCCFLVFFHDVRRISPITQSLGLENAAAVAAPAFSGGPRHEFSVLIGIFTRHRLRLVYGTQPPTPLAEVDVKFVLCNLTKEDQRVLIALEILRFDDIVVLNCTENMDDGKTYVFFSSLPGILPRRYDYVMKADDDTFIRLGSLAASLRPLPREDLYYGFGLPCGRRDPFPGFMSGMGYVLSWDLVEWIAVSKIPSAHAVGAEDKLVGKWFDAAKKAKNRYNAQPLMYDFPRVTGKCSHELTPETVAVHKLKTLGRWVEVLRFFNVTRALKPSRVYHID